jgi:tryptophanyl-tRNA synthetase
MKKQTLVSGMQPTGRLHIGNFLGALKNFVDLQNSGLYECYFPIVDLHSITENFDVAEKSDQILGLAADYIAAGLDPKKSTIFLQSHVAAHSELAWILSTITPLGELERMTQYKDKASRQASNINVGLLTYPVLMAADILLYDPDAVPVGDDQLQHLELTRTLARKFNKRFGEIFIEPKGILTKTPRVMSLKDPSKKMSKSQPEGCLFLDDSPKEIAEKIAHAVTDSGSDIKYDPHHKPGVANLLEIYGALTHMEPKLIADEFGGKNYSQLKMSLAEVVSTSFAEFREKKEKLLDKPKKLIAELERGAKKAGKIAEKKMTEVRKKIGIEL